MAEGEVQAETSRRSAEQPVWPVLGRGRCLPLPRPELLAPATPESPVKLFAAAGTPVHVIEDGRVVGVDRESVGEVVVALAGDRFHRYRGLRPASIDVERGDGASAGSIIGVVGEAADREGEPPSLVLGLQASEGGWLDVYSTLVGLPDPSELDRRSGRGG